MARHGGHFSSSRSRKTSRKVENATIGTHVERQGSAPRSAAQRKPASYSNARVASRASESHLDTLMPTATSGEDAASYRRRSQQRRYVESLQRKARIRRIVTALLAVLVVAAVALGAGWLAFRGVLGSQMMLRDSNAAEALKGKYLYIDRETLTFTRMELSLDMTDSFKAARMMLVRKPLALRFTPKELSIVVTYRMQDGRSRLEYFRSTMRFNCDWKKRLIATSYTAVNELVVTNLRQPAVQIPRAEMFRTSDILNDKAKEFLDPDFWKDYNIIEPDETLEHAIDRLKKRR